MAKTEKKAKALTTSQMRSKLDRIELELQLNEAIFTQKLFRQIAGNGLAEAYTPERALADTDEREWVQMSHGSSLDPARQYEGQPSLENLRAQSYRAWRRDPHARGILRAYVKFIIGRDFGLDFEDDARGSWQNRAHAKLVSISDGDERDPVMVRELWEDFDRVNGMRQRFKETVLRTFRDGEAFIRRFVDEGRVVLRFMEPTSVDGDSRTLGIPDGDLTVKDDDVQPEDEEAWEDGRLSRSLIGKPTSIKRGIEFLKADVETVVAYWLPGPEGTRPTRVPVREVIHIKCLADSNDLRGYPLLDAVLRKLTNYEQWEEYRLVLNKVRTAVALVRKVEGTAAQGAALVAGRTSANPMGRLNEPSVANARRETMLRPGTMLNAGPGVSYSYESPKLDARDAGEDGRRILLTIAAGVGLPEMIITGDWSNANYASSVESRTPAVREWEDWQDFFEPFFVRIWRWVYEAAILARGLPNDTKPGVSIQWPSLISKDAWKETERHAVLNQARILSKTTWSGLEDLVQDEELENFAREDDLELLEPKPDPNVIAQAELRAATAASAAGAGPNGTPAKKSISVAESRQQALMAFTDLEESLTESTDSRVKQAVQEYLKSARPYVDALAEAAVTAYAKKGVKMMGKPKKKKWLQ